MTEVIGFILALGVAVLAAIEIGTRIAEAVL